MRRDGAGVLYTLSLIHILFLDAAKTDAARFKINATPEFSWLHLLGALDYGA